jgi:hypothetical protein
MAISELKPDEVMPYRVFVFIPRAVIGIQNWS